MGDLDDDEVGICRDCGVGGARFAPDPYRHELYDDPTPVWLCSKCRHGRYMDT